MRHATPSAMALSAAFRALPLLSSDLPYTTISVSHSFVRPNDRGKEVLSFIVSVDPGNNKPRWKVEKMYSDVLSLDQRVRSAVGKGVGKRIANLPEGKLWKDHAPARVDQRKVRTRGAVQPANCSSRPNCLNAFGFKFNTGRTGVLPAIAHTAPYQEQR